MADVTTFYPGGAADAAVPHATNSVETDTIDDQNATATGALLLWSGTQEEYDAIVANPPANHDRTIYNVR